MIAALSQIGGIDSLDDSGKVEGFGRVGKRGWGLGGETDVMDWLCVLCNVRAHQIFGAGSLTALSVRSWPIHL